VRTLSVGVQALRDDALRFLGRRHRRAEALRAIEVALEAGFDVVSMDLIYGLPGQRTEDWVRDLREAAALSVHHLSCYELTVHDGTPFERLYRRKPTLYPDPDRRAELFLATHRVLAELGWDGYEVSSFARIPAARSRHNQKYWRHAPYLGLGPSAHSFDGAERWWNERELASWARAVEEGRGAVAGRERIGAPELALEMLMLGLRTRAGVDLERLRRRAGLDLLAARGEEIARLELARLATVAAGRLVPALEGMAVADALALRLGT
jgi:oxygen-independent coproporphyrinogen-3 oxidase